MTDATCPFCGAPLQAEAERCPDCGAEVGAGAGDVAPTRTNGNAEPLHGPGWYRTAFVILGFLFLASALAVVHLELSLH